MDRDVKAGGAVIDEGAPVRAASGGAVSAYREQDGVRAVLERNLRWCSTPTVVASPTRPSATT
jgi:hypothetical protein